MNPDMQPDLFESMEVPLPAVNMPLLKLRRHHMLILHGLQVFGPLADEQMVERLGIPGNSIRPRRLELAQRFYIEKADRVASAHGKTSQRWRLTDRGVEALDQEVTE